MKDEVFQDIFDRIGDPDNADVIRTDYPDLSEEAFLSILASKHRVQTSKFRNLLRMRRMEDRLLRRWQAGATLMEMARENRVPPVSMVRVFLKTQGVQRKTITRLLKEPRLIGNERMRREVVACLKLDPANGPEGDAIRAEIGVQYERRLESLLGDLGLPFRSEEDLRRAGLAKTPDVVLVEPIVIDDFVVHWIDSKAMFGDPASHTRNMQQLRGYVNRFGSGSVLYWFDYVDSLAPPARNEHVLVINTLPPGTEISRTATAPPDGTLFHMATMTDVAQFIIDAEHAKLVRNLELPEQEKRLLDDIDDEALLASLETADESESIESLDADLQTASALVFDVSSRRKLPKRSEKRSQTGTHT
ncbi:MAG: hypothetical protein MHM6MM_000170 [Cercozoa sp. M6MM]